MSNPRISKITVGRLFNLGSYEHVRYELTVEIPEGESAVSAITGMERLLEAMNPAKLRACKSEMDLKRDEVRLQEEALMTDEEFRRRHGNSYVGTRSEYQERCRKSWQEEKERRAKIVAAQKNARQMFDDLGGAAHWKDAKLDWEDDYQDDDDL